MKIGVFDSGLGGLSVANAIKNALPEHEVILREDHANVPYGTKQPAELLKLVIPIFDELVSEGCEVIVIACNTVSTTLIKQLRNHCQVELLAVEPMVKMAAKLTRSRTFTICATPTTLASKRYAYLKNRYAKNMKILEPDCHDWSAMIEHKKIDKEKIRTRIEDTLSLHSDVIVLGCTHYHWIEQEIKQIVDNRAIVLQPEPIIVGQLAKLISQRL
jgi:glutamate racemase